MEEARYLEMADWISRYMKGEIDHTAFENWLDESEDHRVLYERLHGISGTLSDRISDQRNQRDRVRVHDAWERMKPQLSIPGGNNKTKRWPKRFHFMGYAAAVLIILTVAGYFFMTYRAQQHPVSGHKGLVTHMRGGVKLYTTDNHVTDLDEKRVFEKMEGKSVRITNKSNTLHYQDFDPESVEKMLYNRITVSKGREYRLRLSDNTLVYLNAESSLRFPVSFTGKAREVEVAGEAYFEVSPSDRPFIVHTDYGLIRVLGTKFNVKSYKEDQLMETTLVDGSVLVGVNGQRPVLLRPSQQAVFNKGMNVLSVGHVDAGLLVFWKDGQLIFKDRTLEYILTALSRSYDFELVWDEPSLKSERFGFKLNKYETVDPIFELLESTRKVKFERHGRQVHVVEYMAKQ